MKRKQRELYDTTDHSRAGHFPEHAEPKAGREAEHFFLEELDKRPALSQQVEKSGVGNRFIHLISSTFLIPGHSPNQLLTRKKDCWENKNLSQLPVSSTHFFIHKGHQTVGKKSPKTKGQ